MAPATRDARHRRAPGGSRTAGDEARIARAGSRSAAAGAGSGRGAGRAGSHCAAARQEAGANSEANDRRARGGRESRRGSHAGTRSVARGTGAPGHRASHLPERDRAASAESKPRQQRPSAPSTERANSARARARPPNCRSRKPRSSWTEVRQARAGAAGRTGRQARGKRCTGRAILQRRGYCRASGGRTRANCVARTAALAAAIAAIGGRTSKNCCAKTKSSSNRRNRCAPSAQRLEAQKARARTGMGPSAGRARRKWTTRCARRARNSTDLREERSRHEVERARNDSEREHLRETCRERTERAARRPDRRAARAAGRRRTGCRRRAVSAR